MKRPNPNAKKTKYICEVVLTVEGTASKGLVRQFIQDGLNRVSAQGQSPVPVTKVAVRSVDKD